MKFNMKKLVILCFDNKVVVEQGSKCENIQQFMP